jgi:hypothetical protein
MIDVQNEKDKISEKHKCSKLENKFPPKIPLKSILKKIIKIYILKLGFCNYLNPNIEK